MSKGHPLVVTPNSSDESEEDVESSTQKAKKYLKGFKCVAYKHDVSSICL